MKRRKSSYENFSTRFYVVSLPQEMEIGWYLRNGETISILYCKWSRRNMIEMTSNPIQFIN